MSIPENGQGKRLPTDFPYKGEWIIEDLIFLFQPENPAHLGKTQITAGFCDRKGQWKLGFDAMQLASALQINHNDIFKFNETGELILENVAEVSPRLGGSRAKMYTFPPWGENYSC